MNKKATGRPKLDAHDDTVRVGFSVPGSLWEKAMALASEREVSYSALFRDMLEAYLAAHETKAAEPKAPRRRG